MILQLTTVAVTNPLCTAVQHIWCSSIWVCCLYRFTWAHSFFNVHMEHLHLLHHYSCCLCDGRGLFPKCCIIVKGCRGYDRLAFVGDLNTWVAVCHLWEPTLLVISVLAQDPLLLKMRSVCAHEPCSRGVTHFTYLDKEECTYIIMEELYFWFAAINNVYRCSF